MCTLEKRGSLYILTLTGNDDHPTASPSTAAALITTGEGNFFSNGSDISLVESNKDRLLLMMSKIKALFADLISLPMPTIAAVNGLATGTGFMLSLSHDYVFMKKDSGFLYMDGLDSKTIIQTLFFRAKLKAKISSPAVWIDIVTKAEKMPAKNAMEKGILDALEEIVTAAVELGEQLVKRNCNGKGFVENRKFLCNVVLHDQTPTISASLDRIRCEISATPSTSAALITTGEGKFFCNGFDIAWAQYNKQRFFIMMSKVRSLITDLMSLPMPTIASLNGHTSAAGFFLALNNFVHHCIV
ncbi:enoyl-CoA delta isomerase 1, peroxisomal-like [Heracleum sosnowskyi]|uniref:Enoyl-CoA delta isomerase 1, peroxisomal-like n=1 Tax=Heracleum sosnowskyi TaxID=360622 RepID=A0AAD8GU57_9APIA|nr:enoyl-CoA delta isomerase 1, peroxisomal-like [Heracleum sosnowskyi]